MRKKGLQSEMLRNSRTPAADDNKLPAEAEEALARKFVDRQGKNLRYVDEYRRWLIYDGNRWAEDKTRYVFHEVREICREVAASSKQKVAVTVGRSSTVAGVERLARSDRRVAATPEQFDANPMLLNTPGGTVDLLTGRLRKHERKDLLTKVTAVTPHGQCPTWYQFLEHITDRDVALQRYFKISLGYCLTGDTSEGVLFFAYGTGANGKSVFQLTISNLMGDYAKNAPMETFLESRNDRHSTELAMLRGARFVTATETEEGKRWNEGLIKRITGGDRITARLMRQDFTEFTPELKLFITGNHRPSLRTVDESIRRRFRLIPFQVTIPVEARDKQLLEKLRVEAPGILAWMVEGAAEWANSGLPECAAVDRATEEYLSSEDVLQRWLTDRCVIDPEATALTQALFADWRRFCAESEEYPHNARRFSQRLLERGFKPWKHPTLRRAGFRGLALAQESSSDIGVDA